MTTEQIIQRLLNTRECAHYLGVSESYLRRARMDGATGRRTPGPPYYRLGRAVRYRVAALDQWLEVNRGGGV